MNQLDSEFKNKFNKAIVVILTQTRDSTKDTYISNRITTMLYKLENNETLDKFETSLLLCACFKIFNLSVGLAKELRR